MEKALKTGAEIIGQLEDSESAVKSGPNSAMGKRMAYQLLVVHQRENYDGKCNITIYSLYTSYNVSVASTKVYPAPALLHIDDCGIIIST